MFFSAIKCKFTRVASIPYFVLVGRKEDVETQQFKRDTKSCGKVKQPEPI